MNMEKLITTMKLGDIRKPPVRVHGGLLHKMYHVITSDGEFAVKVLNPEIMKRPDALSNMINSERIASAFAGVIPLVCAIESRGKHIQYIEGEYYLVFPWLEGTSVFGKNITARHCETIGRTIGKIHERNLEIEAVTEEEEAFEMFAWDEYAKYIMDFKEKEREWTAVYQNACEEVKHWNKKACDSGRELLETSVISHRDLDPKNVMWKGEQAYVIDWESAGYVNPFQELLEVINYWADDGSGTLDKEKFDVLISEYRKYVNIRDVDWDIVFCASYMGMLGWLDYNMKRALGMEVSDEDEITLGERQVVETIRELYFYQEKIRQMKEWLGGK